MSDYSPFYTIFDESFYLILINVIYFIPCTNVRSRRNFYGLSTIELSNVSLKVINFFVGAFGGL